MLPREINSFRLNEDDYLRVMDFYRRFCTGELGKVYGNGHLFYACHAAFPLLLSPDLANLVWVNFKSYVVKGDAVTVNPVAAADLLQSGLCKQIGHQRYELIPEIRNYLLQLLKDGKWFSLYGIKTGGAMRLYELASFTWQYAGARAADYLYDGAGFRQLNEWASLAYLDPSKLAGRMSALLLANDEKNNRHGQLWLSNQMDRIEQQFDSNIIYEGNNREVLQPFYNLFYYTKARKAELLKKGAEASYDYASRIGKDIKVEEGKEGKVIKLKLSKNVAERADRKIRNVQRVLGVIAVSNDGSQRFTELLLSPAAHPAWEFEKVSLAEGNPNPDTFREDLERGFKLANAEDILFIYSDVRMNVDSGTMSFDQGAPDSSNIVFSAADLPRLLSGKVPRNLQTVILFESVSGTGWWHNENEVFITMVRDADYVGGINSGYGLARQAARMIGNMPAISYQDLVLWMRYDFGEGGETFRERPVCWTDRELQACSFFSKRKARLNSYHLIVYDEPTQGWVLLHEDFKSPFRSTTAQVYEYGSGDKIEGVRGEFFMGQGNGDVRFGASGLDGLDRNKLYMVREERGTMNVRLKGGDDGVMGQWLDEVENAIFSPLDGLFQWNAYTTSPSGSDEDDLKIELLDGGIQIEYSRRDQVEGHVIFSWLVQDRAQVAPLVRSLNRYEYLRRLDFPGNRFTPYAPLGIYLYYGWIEPGGDTSLEDMPSVPIEMDSFYIEDGKVRFYPLEVEVYNAEHFPVFFEVYVLCSDLEVRPLGGKEAKRLLAGERVRLRLDDANLLERMANRLVEVQIKVLASRDMILPDFSQEGFPLST